MRYFSTQNNKDRSGTEKKLYDSFIKIIRGSYIRGFQINDRLASPSKFMLYLDKCHRVRWEFCESEKTCPETSWQNQSWVILSLLRQTGKSKRRWKRKSDTLHVNNWRVVRSQRGSKTC